MSEELKPCPFCGHSIGIKTLDAWIYCKRCAINILEHSWQNAYCWKKLAALQAENERLKEDLNRWQDSACRLETKNKELEALCREMVENDISATVKNGNIGEI